MASKAKSSKSFFSGMVRCIILKDVHVYGSIIYLMLARTEFFFVTYGQKKYRVKRENIISHFLFSFIYTIEYQIRTNTKKMVGGRSLIF